MISSTTYRNDYQGSSSTDTYDFTFPITDTDQLVFLETTAGITTAKILNTDYTVTQNQDVTTGGTVTRVAGVLPTGTQLTVIRIVEEVQDFQFTNQGSFLPENYEAAIDYLMMAVQQLQGQLDKCIQFPEAEVPGTCENVLPAASLRASLMLGFDADGNVEVS